MGVYDFAICFNYGILEVGAKYDWVALQLLTTKYRWGYCSAYTRGDFFRILRSLLVWGLCFINGSAALFFVVVLLYLFFFDVGYGFCALPILYEGASSFLIRAG